MLNHVVVKKKRNMEDYTEDSERLLAMPYAHATIYFTLFSFETKRIS